mgnify:CR=1 FL=1
MKNKMIKLPVFLGCVVAVCGIILALVNALTSPIIDAYKREQAMKSYKEMYQEFNVEGSHISDEIEVSNISGCKNKREIINDSVKGIAYTCQVDGFGGKVDFIVAFGNGKFIGYADLGNSETGTYGQIVIGNMNETVNGLDANSSLSENSSFKSLIAGKSVTGNALADAIENCRADYIAWYEAQ